MAGDGETIGAQKAEVTHAKLRRRPCTPECEWRSDRGVGVNIIDVIVFNRGSDEGALRACEAEGAITRARF